MFGQSFPLIAVGLAIGAESVWAGPIPRSIEVSHCLPLILSLVSSGHALGVRSLEKIGAYKARD